MVVKMIQAKGYLPYYNGEIGVFANKQTMIIRLPHSRIMKVIARSMLLALVILSLPWLGSYIRNDNPSLKLIEKALLDANFDDYSMKFEFLPMLFHDLINEGLYKLGKNDVFLSNGDSDNLYYSQISTYNEMNVILNTDTRKQDAVQDENIDFIFTPAFELGQGFIDRTLKTNGIVVIELASDDSLLKFQKPENYNIVYIRRFDSTIIAMKKNSNIVFHDENSQTQRKLFGLESIPSEAKRAALQNLEDVLLEPPRASSGKSGRYLKRTRFLPDLLNDTLEKYPRRVFIDVGLPEKKGGSGTSWFDTNYPTRNLHFEKYKIETLAKTNDDDYEDEDEDDSTRMGQIGMSDWLRKNVKENEYVVMKAEAEVVDEMVNSKSKAIKLVDELFLECKPTRGKRAYWECLALYGRLRDEGVAVHQWWG